MRKYSSCPRYIVIDGKRHLWREILELRRAQIATVTEERQPPLFPLIADVRQPSQCTAAGRYLEPTLFDD